MIKIEATRIIEDNRLTHFLKFTLLIQEISPTRRISTHSHKFCTS